MVGPGNDEPSVSGDIPVRESALVQHELHLGRLGWKQQHLLKAFERFRRFGNGNCRYADISSATSAPGMAPVFVTLKLTEMVSPGLLMNVKLLGLIAKF